MFTLVALWRLDFEGKGRAGKLGGGYCMVHGEKAAAPTRTVAMEVVISIRLLPVFQRHIAQMFVNGVSMRFDRKKEIKDDSKILA